MRRWAGDGSPRRPPAPRWRGSRSRAAARVATARAICGPPRSVPLFAHCEFSQVSSRPPARTPRRRRARGALRRRRQSPAVTASPPPRRRLPSYLAAARSRYQRRIVSGVASDDSPSRSLRPTARPFSARSRRSGSVRRSRRAPSRARSTRFCASRKSRRWACSRWIQPARTSTRNCRGARTSERRAIWGGGRGRPGRRAGPASFRGARADATELSSRRSRAAPPPRS